jgi:hypothetical protein
VCINQKHSGSRRPCGAFACSTLLADAPAGWKDRCFGEDQHAGGASYSISGGTTNLTVEGGGADIWGNNDYGRFVFTPLAGDCEIVATIPYIDNSSTDYGEWLRAGVMMRGSTMHGAQNVAAFRVKGPAGGGNRNKLQKRLAIRGSTEDFDSVNAAVYAPDSGVRMRLRRQGDTFTAWCSTNAPAYDLWELVGTEIDSSGELPSALNLGVCVSRWQDLGPDTYTAAFSDVVARNLVSAGGYAGGITVGWITDTPVPSGSVVGYTVNRASLSSGTFTQVASLGAAAFVYSDTTAGSGTTYVYRVNALVEEGAVTNAVLVGDSLPLRQSGSANASPAPLKGIAAEYYDNNNDYFLVGARVEPYIDNSWLLGGTTVYPANTGNGLTNYDTFRARWNGSVTVGESGCYALYLFVDDIANVYIDGERLAFVDNYQSGHWIYSAPFYLEAGRSHTFQCDVQENSGGEAMRVYWFKAGDSGAEVRMPQTVFEPFPRPWLHRDIGDSPFLGNAHFDSSDRSFSVAAGIGDIDNQHLVWRTVASDFDFMASAELTNPEAAGVNAGLTVRSASAAGARAVSVALVSEGAGGADRKIAVTVRSADGGAVSESSLAIAESVADLRLIRRGSSVLACYRTASSGGWVIATNAAVTLPGSVVAGMQSFAATDALLATNRFSAVTFAEQQTASLSVNAANLEAQIASEGNPLRAEQDKAALPAVGWYWHSEISDVADDSYPVYKSTHWDNGYTELATLNAGNGYAYTDTLDAANTVYFYKLNYRYDFGAFADGSTNDILQTSSRIGVSDGSIDGGGTGLYNAYYRALAATYFPAAAPVHAQIRDLSSWEKGTTSNPMVTAANSDDGMAVGPDQFSCFWSGSIVPPYTGYYSFRTDTDDASALYLGGQRLIQSFSYAGVQTGADVYLEAGVPVPVFYYFQQGGGGGYFRAYWKTGVGTDAEYVGIPVSALTPLAPDGTPYFVDPAGADTFGKWKNIDIGGPAYPGHAVIGGTPEAFDAVILASGNDIWDNADQFHYLFQETSDNFALEGTVNALMTDYQWAKVGLMVRESTEAGSRHIHLMQSYSQGRRLQYRPAANGTSYGYDDAAKTMMNQGSGSLFLPTRFKIVRKGRTLTFFLDDQPVPLTDTSTFEYDISGWGSKTVLAGLSFTSHQNDRLIPSMFNAVKFTVLHDPGTVLILR